ncbi:MAG: TonB-dependent receptor [Acidobacteriales bacterium]|nr:TonB-dependent receptor [Terriglobales bacterium]
MRRLFISVSLFLITLLTSAFAAEPLTIKVVDPQKAAVANARVVLLQGSTVRAVKYTNAEGVATFPRSGSADLVRVLAPGFAEAQLALKTSAATETVELKIATQSETVNVTAAQTEITPADSGVPAAVMSQPVLELLQPVAVSEALRYLPATVVNAAGRRGGLTSLFVRGGESRYNKVLVDGVDVNDAGGTFDFGVVPTWELDRIEFVRGAQSALYGSDAMTSVVQLFSRRGTTLTPEFRFGAEGGTFATARGYASLAGAYKRLDYNLFADQSNSEGQGINDGYANSSQGGNIGFVVADGIGLRLRVRHSNNRSGVQSFWQFNGVPVLPPDADQYARQNNLLGSLELTVNKGRWRHRFTGSDYDHKRLNSDQIADRGCAFPAFLDCGFTDLFSFNRAGFDYTGEFTPRNWFRNVVGYSFENENGFVNQDFSGFIINSHGLRRNHELFDEAVFTFRRVSLTGGVRYVHNESFGDKAVPRVSATVLAWRGKRFLTGTRLRFAYGEGIKEPRLEESFGAVGAFGPVTLPNPNLRAESNRSIETGFIQNFGAGASLSGTYYHNQFTDQIAFSFDPITFTSQYVNLNKALAHGAELEFHMQPVRHVSLDASYVYTATQILDAPLATDPLLVAGKPLLRRPKHAANLLVNYIGKRWGANLGGSFIGQRPDSDFNTAPTPITHAAGYARWELGGWYAVTRWVTAYANVENLFNKKYEEVVGYPGLKANFRAGLRFRVGGER